MILETNLYRKQPSAETLVEYKWKYTYSKTSAGSYTSKNTSHRRWISAKNRTDGETARLEYTMARNNVTRLMRKAKREFEKGICLKSKINPKSFWWYV